MLPYSSFHYHEHNGLGALAERKPGRGIAGAANPPQTFSPSAGLCRGSSGAVRAFIASVYQRLGATAGLHYFNLQHLAQFMLMGRRTENWYVWLAVNTLAVPLYAMRGLHLTAVLYLVFWFNARHGFISMA